MREFPFNEIKQGRHLTIRKLILTTFYGEIYHAKGINSIVDTVRHYLSSDDVDTIDGLGNRDGLKVKFFNADTAIIAGYIYSSGKKQQDTSGHYFTNDTSYYYLSFDCGKTLQLKTLAITKDAPEWINNIYINSKGECWMCFGQGSIWYSNDYGQSFQLLNTITYDELDNDESET